MALLLDLRLSQDATLLVYAISLMKLTRRRMRQDPMTMLLIVLTYRKKHGFKKTITKKTLECFKPVSGPSRGPDSQSRLYFTHRTLTGQSQERLSTILEAAARKCI